MLTQVRTASTGQESIDRHKDKSTLWEEAIWNKKHFKTKESDLIQSALQCAQKWRKNNNSENNQAHSSRRYFNVMTNITILSLAYCDWGRSKEVAKKEDLGHFIAGRKLSGCWKSGRPEGLLLIMTNTKQQTIAWESLAERFKQTLGTLFNTTAMSSKSTQVTQARKSDSSQTGSDIFSDLFMGRAAWPLLCLFKPEDNLYVSLDT